MRTVSKVISVRYIADRVSRIPPLLLLRMEWRLPVVTGLPNTALVRLKNNPASLYLRRGLRRFPDPSFESVLLLYRQFAALLGRSDDRSRSSFEPEGLQSSPAPLLLGTIRDERSALHQSHRSHIAPHRAQWHVR